MDLLEKLITIPQRENSGSTTAQRYDYQYHWAFFKLLKLMGEENDFVLILEFCEDVIVLDSSTTPNYIDFFQIKSKKQAKTLSWQPSDIKQQGTKSNPQKSIIEKLVDNLERYGQNVRTIHLVSNLPFKFKDKLIQQGHSVSLSALSALETEIIEDLKIVMCEGCSKKTKDCQNECLNIIYFDCSILSLETYKSTCIGELCTFLSEQKQLNHINPTALYKTLLEEIKQKSKSVNYKNVKDLLLSKSISKDDLSRRLNKYENDSRWYQQWNELSSSLKEFYPISKIRNIKQEFDKFKEDCLDSSNLLLENVINYIRKELKTYNNEEYNNEELKRIFDNLTKETIQNFNITPEIYNENYILSIIVREYFYV